VNPAVWRKSPQGNAQRSVPSEPRRGEDSPSERDIKVRLLHFYKDLLSDLPLPLQYAVRKSVAECHPEIRPHHYDSDWEEELYHEAAVAAWEALCSFNPDRSSLYCWGLRVVKQHLKRFCDKAWQQARCECDWPRDEDSQEEVEFVDPEAQAVVESQTLLSHLLSCLGDRDRLIIDLYYLQGLTEREIAKLLCCSQKAVNKRIHRAVKRLRNAVSNKHGPIADSPTEG